MAFSVCTIVLGKTNFAGHEENKDNAMKQREPINLDPSCELQKGPISVCSYRLSTAPLCLAQAAAQPDRPQKTKNDGLSYGRLRQLPDLGLYDHWMPNLPHCYHIFGR